MGAWEEASSQGAADRFGRLSGATRQLPRRAVTVVLGSTARCRVQLHCGLPVYFNVRYVASRWKKLARFANSGPGRRARQK